MSSAHGSTTATERTESAFNFIKRTQTRALIVVGGRDEECPAPQSFEYRHAPKTLGVPATPMVYANQGRQMAGRKVKADIQRRRFDGANG